MSTIGLKILIPLREKREGNNWKVSSRMRDDNQPIYFSLNEHGGERTGLYLPCAFYDD